MDNNKISKKEQMYLFLISKKLKRETISVHNNVEHYRYVLNEANHILITEYDTRMFRASIFNPITKKWKLAEQGWQEKPYSRQ